MKKPSESTLFLKVISVGVAIILWMVIVYTSNPAIQTQIKNIPVEYLGENTLYDRGLILSYTDKEPTVAVDVKGRRSDLMNTLGNVHATVDLSHIINTGEYDVPIEIAMPNDEVQIVKRRSSNLTVVVESLQTREVPVRIKQIGNDKNKENLIQSVPERETILIRGTQNAISQVSYAQIIVDVSAITQDSEANYVFTLMDQDSNQIEATKNITPAVSGIEVKNLAYLAKTVPVEIINASSSAYTVTPKSAAQTVIVGVRPDKYDEVSVLKGELPKTMQEGASMEVPLHVQVGEGMYLKDGTDTVLIKAEVVKKATKTVTVQVRAENVPEGMQAVLENGGQLQIEVAGNEGQIDPAAMKASVDLSGQNAGTGAVYVSFSAPDGVTVVGDYTINVTVQ